nr:S8 family serine peptidase [uncultured Roseateles sp.]
MKHDAALPWAEVERSNDSSWSTPVLAVIDDGIGFLHQQLRDKDGRSRILGLWDQSDAPVVANWSPSDMGYGRELSQGAVNDWLDRLSAGQTEIGAYQSLGQAWSRWTHGAHVLSLLAGRVDPLSGVSDEAGELPIVVVQLPHRAFQNTHGNWLNVYVLDGLHYILRKAPPQAPVLVNISLGGHSGPHDGSGMLERAIDALIEREGGRLTVVVAAGNSRLVGAHAQFTLSASTTDEGEAAELWVDGDRNDETPNFIEVWAQFNSIHTDKLTFELRPDTRGPTSVAVPLTGSATRVSRAGGGGAPIAMLYVSSPDGSPNGHQPARSNLDAKEGTPSGHWVQALVGLSQGSNTKGPGLPANPFGRWCIRVINQSPADVPVRAWIARDDGVGTGNSVPRGHLAFTASQMAAGLIRPEGTLSGLAWSRNTVVVGGYDFDLETGTYQMYEDSGSAMLPADISSGVRAGPDMCGPAVLRRETVRLGVGRCGFFSPRPLEPDGDLFAEGTSLAAPVVGRRMALLMVRRGLRGKQQLLSELAKDYPGASIKPSEKSYWTSAYWLPMPATEAQP